MSPKIGALGDPPDRPGAERSRPGYTSGLFATRDLRRVLVYSLNPTGDKDGSEMPYVLKIAAATFDPGLGAG
jgi:D-alanyl-D-alanine carboxypeptidase